MAKINAGIWQPDVWGIIPKIVRTHPALQRWIQNKARELHGRDKRQSVGVFKSKITRELTPHFRRQLPTEAPLMRKKLEKRIIDLVAAGTLGWVKLNVKGGNRFVLVNENGCVIQGFDKKDITKTDIVQKHQITAEEFKAHAERPQVENNLPYMYGDGAGNVTIGIGHKIDNIREARELPFFRKLSDGTESTDVDPDYVEFRYLEAKEMASKDFKFTVYEKLSSLPLKPADIDDLYQMDFIDHLALAKSLFSDLDSYPLNAQIGVVDMAFNLGRPKLTKYVGFQAAVGGRHWLRAGKEQADGRPPLRAKVAEILFGRAAATESFFQKDPSCRKEISGLVTLEELLEINLSN